jgi:hypothetical protein
LIVVIHVQNITFSIGLQLNAPFTVPTDHGISSVHVILLFLKAELQIVVI